MMLIIGHAAAVTERLTLSIRLDLARKDRIGRRDCLLDCHQGDLANRPRFSRGASWSSRAPTVASAC